jgi:hypothetical protein
VPHALGDRIPADQRPQAAAVRRVQGGEEGEAMKERPIIFSAPMVRAILDGSKTQTRRKVAFPRTRESFVLEDHGNGWWPYQSDDGESSLCDDGCEHPYRCPYGQPGDRLWVREAWRHTASDLDEARRITQDIMSGTAVDYRATYIQTCMRELGFTQADAEMADDFETWRPSIHMPRWASRITLEVTSIRVERLQDISVHDAMAEGVAETAPNLRGLEPCMEWRYGFEDLWRSINGPGSWDANPWVWCIEFRRLP